MLHSVYAYFQAGGLVMYPILLGSVWGLALIAERHLFFRQSAHRIHDISAAFFKTLAADGYDRAWAGLSGQSGIMVSLLESACANRAKPLGLIEKNMEEIVLAEVPNLEKNLNTISVLAGLMPILGLLGTVNGMIMTFRAIALHGTSDAQAVADGIAEALITTQAGLIAAIPLILGHLYLSNRYKKIIARVQEGTARVLNHIEEHGA